MVLVVRHGWSDRFREALASWRRALALLLCVSCLLACIHPASADFAPPRDGSGVSVFSEGTADGCADLGDDARGHCCACHHLVATVAFAPATAAPIANSVCFADASTAGPAWPTSPSPEPPRA